MSDRPQLKYVRTDVGFATCPSLMGHKQHFVLSASVAHTPISAGFIDWDFDGLPFCHGRSESLNLNSMACDTAALRKAWGMTAPATGTVPVRERAVHICSHKDVACTEVFDKCLACPERRSAPLPPSLQAEAQAVGAAGDADSLEAGDPS